MKAKANYKAAMTDLREGCQGEQLLQLAHVDRYTGELRRQKATLSRRIAELERTIAAKEGRIKELQLLQRLPAEIAELKKSTSQLAYERDQLRIVVKEWQEIEDDKSTFLNVKVKCLSCSLHFIICTWFPNQHSAKTMICPECGQRKGQFLVWKDIPTDKFIFESVPGTTPLVC